MKIRGKKISTTVALCLIAIACLTGVVIAQWMYQVSLQYHFSITASGNLAVYNVGTTTPYYGVSFAPFTGVGQQQNTTFDILNTGNTAVWLQWNYTGIGWTGTTGIVYSDVLQIYISSPAINGGGSYIAPNIDIGGASMSLAVGARYTLTLTVTCLVYEPLTDAPLTIGINSYGTA